MTTALITDMSQPLATAAGNALEVIEVMETLTGTSVNAALWDLTAALGGEALALGGLAADAADGAARIEQALESGQAAEYFGRMIAAQGGPADFVERWPDRLPAAPVLRDVAMPGRRVCRRRLIPKALGHVVVHLGGGRLREGDKVNPSVGLSDLGGHREAVSHDLPLGDGSRRHRSRCRGRNPAVQAAYALIAEQMPEEPHLIHEKDSLTMARAFLIVMDSVGCGGAPDAAAFGDEGANTLGPYRRRMCGGPRRSGPQRTVVHAQS